MDKQSGRKRVYKVLLVGNVPLALKNDIRRRYLGEGFKSDYTYSCGANFAVKKLEYNESVIYIQTWQVADGPRWESIRKIYYEGALGVIILVDLDHIASFESVPDIIKEILSSNTNLYRHLMPVFMIVGISPSLGRSAKVSIEQLINYARALEYNLDTTAIVVDCQLGCTNFDEQLRLFAENIYNIFTKKNKDLSGVLPDFEIFTPSKDLLIISEESELFSSRNPLVTVKVEGLPKIKIRLRTTFEPLGVKTVDPVECIVDEYEKYVRVYSNIFGLANFYGLTVSIPSLEEVLENPLCEIVFSYHGFDLFKGRFETLIPYFNELVLPIEEKEYSPNPLLKTYFRLRYNFQLFLKYLDLYNFVLNPPVLDLEDFLSRASEEFVLSHRLINNKWNFSFDELVELLINTEVEDEIEFFFTRLLWNVIRHDYIEKMLISLGIEYEFEDENTLLLVGKHANYLINLNNGRARVASTNRELCIVPPKKKSAYIRDPLLTSLLGIKELKLPDMEANLLSVIVTLGFDDIYADEVILNQLKPVEPI